MIGIFSEKRVKVVGKQSHRGRADIRKLEGHDLGSDLISHVIEMARRGKV